MDGVRRKKRPVGYCRCEWHKGLLSVELMKKKGCLKKDCKYLYKYPQHEYWEYRAMKRADKKARKKANES